MRFTPTAIFASITASLFLATNGFTPTLGTRASSSSKSSAASCGRASVVPGAKPIFSGATPYSAWLTSATPDGTAVYINCAWKRGKRYPEFDAAYFEIARYPHDAVHSAERLQHIGRVWIATKATNLNDGSKIITANLESFTKAGAIATKECTVNTNTDTLTACKESEPFVSDIGAAIKSGEQAESDCRAYVEQLAVGGSITNDDFCPQKSQGWFRKLRAYIWKLTR
ncbi:MAG: hypothetical protein P4M13_04305 [Alphaproteobacteria bacterium]|nr:hypothetical protein [Alphaproteobacteria bacterium]